MGNGLTSPLAQRWGIAKDIPQGRVYIGSGYADYTGGTPTAGYAPMQDMTTDVDSAMQAWGSLSPTAQRKIINDMYEARGYEVPITDAPSFYADTVRNAYQVQQSQGLKVTPLEYWDYQKQVLGGVGFNVYDKDGKGRGGGRYMGPVTTESVTETINLSDPSTARQFLDNALGDVLGRLPTADEYETFRAALNAAQEAAPSVTESVTTTTPQGKARSKVRSKQRATGGISEAQMATEFARSQEMAAETLGGTAGFTAFLDAIGG